MDPRVLAALGTSSSSSAPAPVAHAVPAQRGTSLATKHCCDIVGPIPPASLPILMASSLVVPVASDSGVSYQPLCPCQRHASGMPVACQRHARCIPEACQMHARGMCQRHAGCKPESMPEACQRQARECQRHARGMPDACQRHARKCLRRVCQRYARGMPEASQRHARGMPGTCQRHACQRHARGMPDVWHGMFWGLAYGSIESEATGTTNI